MMLFRGYLQQLSQKTHKNLYILRCQGLRFLYSSSGTWPTEFSPSLRKQIEDHWVAKLSSSPGAIASTSGSKRPKHYVLSMFPYPSGNLHMGHVRVYTISDAMARYYRLKGLEVIHPMGWDAFGLPAENAAIDRGEIPANWTNSNIEIMRKQLNSLCCSFDWHREVATCTPAYYKWTQYLFLMLYEKGLIYQDYGKVNWDPVDQTVLANEQIDENGCSWRSGAKVEKRFMRQWYIATTAYSKSLYDSLDDLDINHWSEIISIQKELLGKCDGTRLRFSLPSLLDFGECFITVFTRYPECIFGASHLLVSPEHFLNDEKYYSSPCTPGEEVIELNVKARNPISGASVPIFLHHSWTFEEEADCHLGIPCASVDDKQFCISNGVTYSPVVDDRNCLINSKELSGLTRAEAFTKVLQIAKTCSVGGHLCSSKSRDWLISRQRYWGTPIPIVHCAKYGAVPVNYADLPVVLPEVKTKFSRGQPPLQHDLTWQQVKCARCDCEGFGHRETDTMDTFVDSAWYFLRYLDPFNHNKPFSREAAMAGMPVDLYIGGKEHATLHLYFARFFAHFLYDQGLLPTKEPFKKFLSQGRVMGRSYRTAESGRYVPPDEVIETDSGPVEKTSKLPLISEWEKMSKSKFNGVDPQHVLAKYGVDSTRLCILAGVAPKSDRPWSDDAFAGIQNWQRRMWNLLSRLIKLKETGEHLVVQGLSDSVRTVTSTEDIFQVENETIARVTHYMEDSFLLSTAISWLQNFTNILFKSSKDLTATLDYQEALASLIIMISPFCPLFASEMWTGLRSVTELDTHAWEKSVHEQNWPEVSKDFRLPLTVKVQSKTMFKVPIPCPLEETASLTVEGALKLAQASPLYETALNGKTPQHVHLDLIPSVSAVLELKTKSKKKTQHTRSENKVEETTTSARTN